MRVNTRGQKRPAKISTAKRQAKFEKKSFNSPQEAHASKAIVEGLSLDEFSRLPLPNKLPIPAGVNIDPFAPRPMPKTSKPRAEQKVFDSPQEAHASKTAPKPFSKDELEVLEQSWLEVKAGWLEVKAKIRTGNPAKFIPALEAHRDTIDYVLACCGRRKSWTPAPSPAHPGELEGSGPATALGLVARGTVRSKTMPDADCCRS